MAALLMSAANAFAYDQQIRDIEVNASLCNDGSALITEKWDVTVADGTEWYLVRDNLGAADIVDLEVSDENVRFSNIGRWNVDASIRQKEGKCGLNPLRNGYEICWGVGSYGPHRYTVTYRITDAVDLLEDADCFHFQLVSPGLSATPEHVKVTVGVRGTQLDSANVRFWGFGFNGPTYIEDGMATFESADGYYTRNSSVIALLRFDKGLFSSGNIRDVAFQEVLDGALKNADFGSDGEEDDSFTILGLLFTSIVFYLALILPLKALARAGKPSRRKLKKLLGCKPSEVGWWRDIPCKGSLCASDYLLKKLGEPAQSKDLTSAMMLRMIYKGVIEVRKNADGKTEFSIIPTADRSYMGDHEREFFDILTKAAGDDSILQDKEFSKWARRNAKELYNWSSSLGIEGADDLRAQGCISYTPEGQEEARHMLGFKKFLNDFTRMQEKQSMEAVLWQEYLVFASMFGIADKVAKEMKDINPDLYASMMPSSAAPFPDVYVLTNSFGRHMSTGISAGRPVPEYSRGTATSSWGGMGGHSSFGGGGGFHGGGFGGGSR